MAQTSLATGNALTKKAWHEKLFRDTVKESYFMQYATSGSESLVQTLEDLTKSKGDNITFGIRMRLTGAGVTSGSTLEGAEEALTTYSNSVSLEQYRHAVRDDGAMTRQRAMFDVPEESRAAIRDWGAEKIDSLCFTEIQSSPTRVFYQSTSTSTPSTASTALTASDLLTPALISRVRTWAKTGGNRTQTPIRPVRIKGKDYWVLLVHPDVRYDLVNNSTYAQARREAEDRGAENPIFTGALGVWDGVIVHEHENINLFTNGGGGSDVPYATCVFMGAQALLWAWGMRKEVQTEKTFDYDDQQGFAWGMIAKPKKPVFNSKDYGSIGVYVARTRISDVS